LWKLSKPKQWEKVSVKVFKLIKEKCVVYAVETYDLTRYYSRGRIQALEGVSLKVETGKIFSLLGPNGAGKTTLIKLLLKIVHPTRGEAKILGQPVSDYRVHGKIGYLAENHQFPDFLNAWQVLYYYGRMSGMGKFRLREKIPQLLKLVKLEKWAKVRIRKFSKGMLQRLGIAQALIYDPELLILDEPTDGIDPVGRREVRDLLKSLREEGKTIFLNSHLLSEVERVSDEIAILKEGRLLEKGSIGDFISVKDQYQLQVQDGAENISGICRNLRVGLREQNGAYLVSVEDERHLNQLIDALREKEILITALTPRKISLEDFFIEVVEDKKDVSQ